MTNLVARIASITLGITGLLVALGAYGHGFVGRLDIDAELAKHAIADDTRTMLYVVWFFVSGAMLLFGVACMWAAARSLRRRTDTLGVPLAVGAMYLIVGLGGFVYRSGDPFMLVFVALGALLVTSAIAILATRHLPTATPR